MQFGLMTEPQLGMTYEEIVNAAQFAESIGLDVFARSDHFAFPKFAAPHATEAFTTLAGLARDTNSIDLCVLVSPIMFRHPGVIAKMAATIDEMSGGRLTLGIGTGWMDDEHNQFGFPFPDLGERFDRLEESLGYIRAALGKAPPGFDGEYYNLESGQVLPGPTGPLPIVIGGSGPRRTPFLAGTFGEEFNMGAMPADDFKTRVDRAREAATAAGRDPDALMISVMGSAIVGKDETAFRENLERVAAADPFGRDAEGIETRMRERGLPIGTAAEAREAIARLAELGVSRFYLQHFGPFDNDLLGEMFEVVRG